MPVKKDDRLKFVEFLGVVTGLLGIIVASPSDLYFPPGAKQGFFIYVIAFIIYSVVAYGKIVANESRGGKYSRDAAVYFSWLLAFMLGASFSSGYSGPVVYQQLLFFVAFGIFGFLFYAIIMRNLRAFWEDSSSVADKKSSSQ